MTVSTANGLALSLKAIARLLHYPDRELLANSSILAEVLLEHPGLSVDERALVRDFMTRLRDADPYDLQAEYVATFDHSKKVSLYLFEHVYGESRERGPAMVELINAYREKGLEMDSRTLPDYLPLFLEFCALLPEAEARAWLKDTGHVLQQIHVRLVQRDSDYAVLFRVLLSLLELEHSPQELRETAAGEERDDTRAAFDRVWMETPVTFGPEHPGAGCSAAKQGPEAPIQWRPRRSDNGRSGTTQGRNRHGFSE
jgi:nitrate reductase delta subunit